MQLEMQGLSCPVGGQRVSYALFTHYVLARIAKVLTNQSYALLPTPNAKLAHIHALSAHRTPCNIP